MIEIFALINHYLGSPPESEANTADDMRSWLEAGKASLNGTHSVYSPPGHGVGRSDCRGCGAPYEPTRFLIGCSYCGGTGG